MPDTVTDEIARHLLFGLLTTSGLSRDDFGRRVMAGVDRSTLYRWLGGAPIPPRVRSWLAGVERVIPGADGTIVIVHGATPSEPD